MSQKYSNEIGVYVFDCLGTLGEEAGTILIMVFALVLLHVCSLRTSFSSWQATDAGTSCPMTKLLPLPLRV